MHSPAHSRRHRCSNSGRAGEATHHTTDDAHAIQLHAATLELAQLVTLETNIEVQRWRQQQGCADWQGP
jgi:hypothetical protein